jgi:hypothetical protein
MEGCETHGGDAAAAPHTLSSYSYSLVDMLANSFRPLSITAILSRRATSLRLDFPY